MGAGVLGLPVFRVSLGLMAWMVVWFLHLGCFYQDLMILLAWMELLWLASLAAFARYDGWDGSDW